MNAEKPQIGGWLHLVRVFLWLGMIVGPLATLGMILELAHQHDFLTYIQSFEEFIGTIFAYFLYSLFKKRKRTFVKWAIIYEVFAIVAKFTKVLMGGMGLEEVIIIAIGACLSVICIAYLLCSKRVKETFIFDVQKGDFKMEIEKGKPKIGGWLHLVRIILWLDMIIFPLASIGFVMDLVGQQSLYNGFNVIQGLISTFVAFYLLYLFQKRRSSFVKWAISFEAFLVVVNIVDNALAPHNYGQLIGQLVMAVIYIWYLTVSKRVKETFIL